ncbi:Uncharacterised protein [Vibrio cholerae]|nr:Uncharacterised protein [Vibrio cholerae]
MYKIIKLPHLATKNPTTVDPAINAIDPHKRVRP